MVEKYISSKDAIDAVRACCLEASACNLQCIRDIPAADVRPVVRGKWIDYQQWQWIYAKCSECETVHDVRSNFCPNCGCAMEET